MKTAASIGILGVTALLAVSAANAQRPALRPLESSIETAANLLDLPTTTAGQLRVRACPDCSIRSFDLDRALLIQAVGKEMTLAQFSAYLAGAGSRPVTVHYRLSDSRVTRITAVVQ